LAYGNEIEYVSTLARHLRPKIEDDPHHLKQLLTDTYIGYRFNEQPLELEEKAIFLSKE
jgi:hypothetical protein